MSISKPVVKLQAKRRIGSKIKKIYEKPRTPCQRLLECESLSPADKQKLEAMFKGLRLSQVKVELDKRLAALKPSRTFIGVYP